MAALERPSAGLASRDPSQLLTPWQGFGVMRLWTVVLMAAAALMLRRRDA
jgi:ABC-2 type transport system permease protein